jgi:hypothetical protein
VNLARIQGLRSEDCLHEYLNRLNSMDEASPLMVVADAKSTEGRT